MEEAALSYSEYLKRSMVGMHSCLYLDWRKLVRKHRTGLGGLRKLQSKNESEGHRLKQRKLQLNTRKNFFPLRVREPWPRLPREAVESPSLEIFKPRLDKVLYSLLWVTLLGQEGWTR